jgi:hypothetical protein
MKIVFTFFLIAMSLQTIDAQKGVVKKVIKKPTSSYLTKSDPVYIAIKATLVNDLTQSAKSSDTATDRNKSIRAKIRTLSEERQEYYQNIFFKSLRDYNEQVHFDFDMFMMLYTDLMKKDQKTLVGESDFRVKLLGGNKYAAELWEDGVVANSEAKALEWAEQISKRFPDNKNTVNEVKATYAKARKDMLSGKQQRYTKIMAFLYTKEKDGSMLFHNPGQAMLDFKESEIH